MDDQEEAKAPARRRPLLARIFRSHDFLRDITVTTLGVLIALAVGEAVDEIRWQFRINATERVMREELGLSLRSISKSRCSSRAFRGA